MNRSELIDAIHQSVDAPKTTIAAVLDAQADVITAHFAGIDAYTEGEATLPGLGKLKLSTAAARVGRNPRTGEPAEIAARVVVRFKAGKALTDAIN